MKKVLSFLLSMLLVLSVLPMGMLCAPVTAEGELESVVLNVKDFGAVGEGKTDDEAAIWATFECALMDYMVKKIPVTVYFPEGEYGLKNGGLYVYLPRGAGDLTIKGDGPDKSTIVYLDEWTTGGTWVALRIYPKIEPESIDQYLHDITIQDMGVRDTNPVKHAWNKEEGDPGTEETHGFNIQHCVRATIKNCKVESVGDEALDMSGCIDSEMRDNLVINSPGAGSAGGGISVGDGCKNVRVANNTILGSIDNPNKTNWAIAIEALTGHIEDIVVENNVIEDIHGYGINIGTPAGTAANITVQNNVISNCRNGGICLSSSGQTDDVHLLNNTIRNTAIGVYLQGGNKDNTRIEGGSIDGAGQGIKVMMASNNHTLIQDVVITDAQDQAVYNAGTDTRIHRLFVDGCGISDPLTNPAVSGGGCSVSDSFILNCQNAKGVQGAAAVTNTYVQQSEIAGYTAMTDVPRIENCWVNRTIVLKSGYAVDGLTLTTMKDLGGDAIVLSGATGCTVTNCRITVPSGYGICETGTANRNTITNNVTVGGSGINTVGANTVADGNVRSTLETDGQFYYYVVDGNATIMAPVDATLSAYTIPETIEGDPVAVIAPWAFALCDRLTTVYYGGDKQALAIGAGNDPLLNAVWQGIEPSYVCGDVNDDGRINNKDLGLLQQYLNGWEVAVNEQAADVNGDGRANNKDLGRLQQYLNGWDVELG